MYFHNLQFYIIILAKGAGVLLLCEGGQGQKKPFNLIFLSGNLFSDSGSSGSPPVIANAVLQASLPTMIREERPPDW